MANSAGVSLTAAMLEEEFTHMSRDKEPRVLYRQSPCQSRIYVFANPFIGRKKCEFESQSRFKVAVLQKFER